MRRVVNLPKEELKKYYKKMTTVQIAEKFDCNPSTVQKYILKYGLEIRKRGKKPFVVAEEYLKYKIDDNTVKIVEEIVDLLCDIPVLQQSKALRVINDKFKED